MAEEVIALSDNIYLNLFRPYSENNNNPKENNLSRGIAILLEENNLFFERFLDFINYELKKNNFELIAKPNNLKERIINIQQSSGKLAKGLEEKGIQRIIPVTLTPEKIESKPEITDRDHTIPDISIFCCNESNDSADLILIEVKQYQLNADAQVLEQAHSIKKNNVNDSEISIIEPVTRITWQDIIKILQNIQRLQEGRSDFVLNHYLEYLKPFHQEWFPPESFRAGMDKAIWNRIWPLANNCAALLKLGDNSVGESDWSYKISLKECNYLKEVHIALYYNSDNSVNGINICLFPGNTGGQSWDLFANNPKIANSMSWINEKNLTVDNINLSISTKFYLHLFSSFGSHIMSAYLSNNIIGTDKTAININFCRRINGKWYRENWEELKNFLIKEHPGILENQENFITDFEEKIQQSGKTCFCAALGFEIVIDLDFDLLAKLDKSNNKFMYNPENDAVARVITSALTKLRQIIEGEE